MNNQTKSKSKTKFIMRRGNRHRHGAEGWERKMRMKGGSWGFRRPKHNIPVNIIEHDDHTELRVHALTYHPDNINISVTDDILYITGTREPEVDKPNFILQEYPIKSFERSFELGGHLDLENISAKMDNGVLVITIAQSEKSKTPDRVVKIS